MASLAVSVIRSLVALLDSPITLCSFLHPLTLGRPRDPISTVSRLVVNPASLMLDTRSKYLASFLLAASSRIVSKGIVSSRRVAVFVLSFHQTMSGRRSVVAR